MNNLCSRMNTMNPISSAAAEAIASNEDLLQEILIRVPAKPLLKFKSVSKQWLSLISSSHFCRCHAQRHREAAALLFHFRGPYVPSGGLNIVSLNDQCSKVPSFDFVSDSSVRILQSCNGLLLCRSFDNSRLKYFVCNPTTKKFKVVSFLPQLEGFVRAVNLAYDPLKSAHFKIIAIRELIQLVGRRFQMDIYSSKTDSWGSRVVNFAAENNIRFEIGVFCNGAIHWDSKASTSLFFEVEKMNLEKMPMPMPIAPQGSSAEIGRYLGESCRHLQLAIGYMPPLQIDIFEMASDYSNWFMKHRVNLETVMKAIPEINLYGEEGVNPVHSLCVLPSEKDEASKVVAFVNWKAISYDFNDGTLRKLCDLEPCPILRHTRPFLEAFHVFQYFESLACV